MEHKYPFIAVVNMSIVDAGLIAIPALEQAYAATAQFSL
jgi:hypothetical protein